MSPIIAFYECLGTDGSGRTLDDILSRDDAFFEKSHNYVQWLFPLPEASVMHPESPILNKEDLERFRSDATLNARVLLSLARMRVFLDNTLDWRRPFDHNHLRITRIIRFLTLTGNKREAEDLHEWILSEIQPGIHPKTIWYWKEALNEGPAWLGSRTEGLYEDARR